MKLEVTFRDSDGVQLRTFTGVVEYALQEIKMFVITHGTDPFGGGEGAAKGSITFTPIKESH